jgi:hypothetical protein
MCKIKGADCLCIQLLRHPENSWLNFIDRIKKLPTFATRKDNNTFTEKIMTAYCSFFFEKKSKVLAVNENVFTFALPKRRD